MNWKRDFRRILRMRWEGRCDVQELWGWWAATDSEARRRKHVTEAAVRQTLEVWELASRSSARKKRDLTSLYLDWNKHKHETADILARKANSSTYEGGWSLCTIDSATRCLMQGSLVVTLKRMLEGHIGKSIRSRAAIRDKFCNICDHANSALFFTGQIPRMS